MGKYRKFLMASILSLSFQKNQAQKTYAVLEKNVNPGAKDLIHELNITKDTLLLKSHKPISYVYAINSKYAREIDKYIFENTFKVSLTGLSQGKHLFVVGQDHKKIVFVVKIFKDDEPTVSLLTGNPVTVSDR
uniref:hypothetical protein n=2 Tax=Gelidibacter sp. TaxID=2018083 RepID=UPI00404906FC